MAVLLLYCPAPTMESAQQLAEGLLNARLVACVNMLPGLQSMYWWDGALVKDTEVLILAKTTAEAETRITEYIQKTHPYDVPCISFIPVVWVNQAYAEFVRNAVVL